MLSTGKDSAVDVKPFVDVFAQGRTGLGGWIARRRAWLMAVCILRDCKKAYRQELRNMRVLSQSAQPAQPDPLALYNLNWSQFVRTRVATAIPVRPRREQEPFAAYLDYFLMRQKFIDDLNWVIVTILRKIGYPAEFTYGISQLTLGDATD